MRPPALLLLATLVPSPAAAQNLWYMYWTGNNIHQLCENGPELAAYVVTGISDGLQAGATGSCLFSIPNGVKAEQVRDVFCQYVASNPATRHMPASQIASEALSSSFPCK